MSLTLGGNIFVSGSNRGIGLELVKQLAEKTPEDTCIYAGCRTPDGSNAQALRDLAAKHAGKICIVKLEMSDEESIACAVRTVSEKVGAAGLNLLINNAAIAKPAIPGKLCDTSRQDMMEVYETNVAGPFLLTKMFIPLLQKAAASSNQGDEMSCRRSAVINVSTLGASLGMMPESFHIAQLFAYRSSKAAMNMLSCCFAMELKSQKILVMALHPGWVQTDMGGDQAPTSTHDSVQGMLNVMSSLGSKDTASFLDWNGDTLPW
eukprot:XP_003976681.1 PREDICTED: uncharacterized oxidoreductase C663.09c-like [Takifugu rubripes]